MSKLTLDEAIKHCLETAEQLEERANIPYKGEDSELQDNACRECAADHRQLAKWLTDYKELEAKHWDECRQIAHYDNEIKELEAADVQFIKHGQWDFQGYQLFKCTNCTKIYTQEQLEDIGENWTFPNFCPNCGANMKGDVKIARIVK